MTLPERCRTISETWPLATAWRRPTRHDCRRTPAQRVGHRYRAAAGGWHRRADAGLRRLPKHHWIADVRGVHHPPRCGIPGAEPGTLCSSADGGAYDDSEARAAVPYRDANAGAALLPAASSGDGDTTAAASLELVGYIDANLAGCLDSGRSTTGGLFLVAGGVVAFSSRLQQSVARSTMESEYMALFDAAQEAEQLRTLLAHLGLEQTAPTVIHEDNTAALAVTMAAGHTHQSRHIRIRFARELVAAGVIAVEQVSTADQLADGLTKNVGQERLLALRARTMG
ncbi:unnamed protein product [Phaeothamnion confervicola]